MTVDQLNAIKNYLLDHKVPGCSAREILTMVQWIEAGIQTLTEEAEIQAKTDGND